MHMDDEVVRNNTIFISTSLAAEITGYARDYIGQLARDGHFDSTKIGHKRFVDRSGFVSYALDNKSGLGVSDIPENHTPDDIAGKTDTSAGRNTNGERTNQPGSKPTVIAGPETIKAGSFQTQPGGQTPDRLSSRWRKSADRMHAGSGQAQKTSKSRFGMSKLSAAAVSVLIACVVSLGIGGGRHLPTLMRR